MIARPSAKFARPRVHISLIARPYERRSVCVLPASQARNDHRTFVGKCDGGNHTHFTRDRVIELVARWEMTFLDPRTGTPTARHTNLATYTDKAAGTWQKTRSGPVHAMQLKVGLKGRHVPAGQREPEMVMA